MAELLDVSTNASPIFTLFDTETVDELTRDHILRLAVGVLGAVRVRGFGSPEECAEIMEGLDHREFGAYDENLIFPPIAKIGPAAYDFYGAHTLTDDYWDVAADARRLRGKLYRGTDPMDLAVERIGRAWGDGVEPARSKGRELFSGMIREIHNGAKLHFDEIVREFPGVLDETPASFLTLNWYLSMPEQGGETRVYRRRWKPTDEPYRDGYGYDEQVVAEEPVAVVRPEAGDVVIFDSRNLHAVNGISGEGRRVSLSFFLGVTGRGPLQVWS
ncbi:putative 2OG-Fe(II) oxygenase [Kitasatospora brasiliensis]|uniref:2OG-Fe(II)-dependent halogenase WelO5 family protein n=1 Tax=Kitasatospora brasiliensis TaxID=3058040 RepID=UPI00292E5B64|nr:putative 2OG-Fe(II) oxygenase [Kitasatospora sp. K002]